MSHGRGRNHAPLSSASSGPVLLRHASAQARCGLLLLKAHFRVTRSLHEYGWRTAASEKRPQGRSAARVSKIANQNVGS